MAQAYDRITDTAAQAVAAVDALLEHPERDPDFEPRDEASAAAAVARFAIGFASAAGWVKDVVEGARAGAQTLSGDRLQGLAEIVQNADDVHARHVRLRLESDALLVAHDGRPIKLRDVYSLSNPWVTSKSGDAAATGRFGIGLMTLQTLSSALEVFSGPYRFRIGDSTLAAIDHQTIPDGFAERDDTVLRIPLDPAMLDAAALDAWFARWDEASLIFCSDVAKIDVEAGDRLLRTLHLSWEDLGPGVAEIGGREVETRRRYARASDGRVWAVYTADVPAPAAKRRARKAVGGTTPLGVAIPLHGAERGEVYAGLPVVATAYPLRVNAQFDPLTGRQRLAADSSWNVALCPLVADLWVATVIDVFASHPTAAWRIVPIDEPREDPRLDAVADLESKLLVRAREVLPSRLVFDVSGRAVPLAELAVEDPRLEGILSDGEICHLAGLDAALPGYTRDEDDQWRTVLDDWREAGADLPPPVSVEDALALFEDDTRSPDACVALAAAALDERLGPRLAGLRCVVTDEEAHIRPPGANDPWLLASGPGGLAGELGLAQRLHSAYVSDTEDARAVHAWLSQRGSIGDPADTTGVLRRVVAMGKAGRRLATPLTDNQLRALRDSFEALSPAERASLGPGVGRAITIDAYSFGPRRRRVACSAAPAETYLPRAIDKDPDSFAVAAADTPGLLWAHARYADALRSPLGRSGLGAQRFLRLLGAETAPRLVDHPSLQQRFASEARRGLHQFLLDNPPGRLEAIAAFGASYTLEDRHSPDLTAVLTHIGQDRRATRRRERASAMLATLGRAWDRFADFTEVDACYDYYGWHHKGTVHAFWIWHTATIPWLDDNTATPSAPAELRLRTPSTVAVHGPNAAGYVHKDISVQRIDVLAALGVTGEPSTGDLINRLRELRDAPATDEHVSTDAALIYRGLADRLAGRRHIAGDLTRGQLRQAFAAGSGLILTNLGWRPPSRVFAGKGVFGDRRAFAPLVPGAERLWSALEIRSPSIDDCAAVLADLARTRAAPGPTEQAITLDTLRLLSDLLAAQVPGPATTRRLARLSLWTSQGWRNTRPVYAVDDPTLAAGLAPLIPVWQPGGELSQFRALLGHLRLTEVAAESATVVGDTEASVDEEGTELLALAVPLLREDLARNDPDMESALEIGWERLGRFQVRLAPDLRVRIEGFQAGTPSVVPVDTKADPDKGVLYLRDANLLARVDGGGRAIAGLFAADRRRVAQAWLAACDAARAGRDAQRLLLAEERAAEERERTGANIAARLAAFSQQTAVAHARGRAAARAGGVLTAPPGGAPPGPPSAPAPAPRVLIDATRLRVADPKGQLVDRPADRPAGATATGAATRGGGAPKDLPVPASGGAPPRYTAAPAGYTAGTKETVGLELVRKVLASDADEMRDLRAQRGVGADAVDQLDRFYELKVYAGAEPDVIRLEDAQIRRAMSTPDFFLVVVSNVEGERAKPTVRVIVQPLDQLTMTETSMVSFSGVRTSHSLVYGFVPE